MTAGRLRPVAAVAALLALLAAGSASPASAQQEGFPSPTAGIETDPALEARATKLASELRCPVCQGLSIQASPSPLAQQMKDVIRTQLREGRTEAEVRQYFVSKYGEWVLLEPEPRGFNLLVYLLPGVALLAGGGVLTVAVRRWTAAPSPPTP